MLQIGASVFYRPKERRLPHTSPISPPYLPCISPISPLYLPCISQVGLDPEHELPEERYAARVTLKVNT